MKKNPKETSPFEEEMDTDGMEHIETVSGRSIARRQRPKRDGCVSLAGNTTTSLAGGKTTPLVPPVEILGGRAFMRAALDGNASTALAGKTATALAGGAVTSLAGKPGTSLLILTKKEIPKGTVIKKADLEAYVISEPLTSLDETISRKIPVETVAEEALPAHRLVAALALVGNPLVSVSEIKLIPGNALVIKARKPIKKGTVIHEEDLDVTVISSPIKSPDMYVSKEDLVGKVAKESIEENRIVKKGMLEQRRRPA